MKNHQHRGEVPKLNQDLYPSLPLVEHGVPVRVDEILWPNRVKDHEFSNVSASALLNACLFRSEWCYVSCNRFNSLLHLFTNVPGLDSCRLAIWNLADLGLVETIEVNHQGFYLCTPELAKKIVKGKISVLRSTNAVTV